MTYPSRDDEGRSTRERKKTWSPPGALDTPLAPDGVKYRWVRKNVRSEDDTMNVLKRAREGYEPVLAERHPEFESLSLDNGSRFDGTIQSGDLILMEVDEDIANQRDDYFQQKTELLQRSVDHELDGQVRSEGSKYTSVVREQGSEVEFGNSTKEVIFQED